MVKFQFGELSKTRKLRKAAKKQIVMTPIRQVVMKRRKVLRHCHIGLTGRVNFGQSILLQPAEDLFLSLLFSLSAWIRNASCMCNFVYHDCKERSLYLFKDEKYAFVPSLGRHSYT